MNKKVFYRIKEASQLVDVPSYVLRYWESEFPQLKPRKDKGGQRTYTQKDIEKILQIKDLLYVQGYKMEAAREILTGTGKKKRSLSDSHVEHSDLSVTMDKHDKLKKDCKKQVQLIKKQLQQILQDL